jgi:effector-binding domain-containing protein
MLIDAAPRPLAAVRVTTVIAKWPSQFRESLDKVWAAIRGGKLQKGGHNIMVYRHRGDGLVDIECGVETAGAFEAIGDVIYCETPSGPTATTAHIGSYAGLGASHDAVVKWMRANNHPHCGVCWEIYGDPPKDPSQMRIDLFHLVGR